MKFLLDTNVISELWKSDCDATVRTNIDALHEEDLFVSVISVGELARGIALLPMGKRRREIEHSLAETEATFAARFLSIDLAESHAWANLTVLAKKSGRPLAVADGFIAATAKLHQLTLLTRNTSDFEVLDISLLNPWNRMTR